MNLYQGLSIGVAGLSLGMEFDETGAERFVSESATSVCLRKPKYGVYQ